MDKKDSDAVAQRGCSPAGSCRRRRRPRRAGPPIIVGSADFAESETLANIYADYLKALGYNVGTS